MSIPSRLRTPNPHLGAYYGIVTSAFVSLVVMLAMFEQLGWGRPLLAQTMMIVPLALYLVIAVGSRTLQADDFFASGRRVPPVYNGFVLAAVAVGGVGFLAYTGTVFFLGFDALAIGLGWTFGMFVAGVLFVPYLRKAGSYTLPSFLGHRFRSRSLRLTASVMQLPPTALLLAAEIKIAALIAALFLPLSFSLGVVMIAALIAAIAILGGMRSVTWTGSAQFLVGAVGLVVVVTTVSILLTNVPAPQLTYGETFSALHNAEITAGLTPVQPDELATALPGAAPLPTVKPFLQPFGILGPIDFVTLFLCLALGTAALPSLLSRSGVTSSVAEQRRSTAWGLLFVALFVMTAPAMAAFAKLIIFRDIALAPASALPAWLTELSETHLLQAGDANGDGAIGAAELLIGRDGIALALPAAAGLPYVLTVLMASVGDGNRARCRRLPPLHPGGEPGRGYLPRARPPRDAAAAHRRVGGDCRDGACRRRLSGNCRPRSAQGGADGVRLRRFDLLPHAAPGHLVAAMHEMGSHGGAGYGICGSCWPKRSSAGRSALARPVSPRRLRA